MHAVNLELWMKRYFLFRGIDVIDSNNDEIPFSPLSHPLSRILESISSEKTTVLQQQVVVSVAQ